jgi:hypothetical protein
LFCQQVAAITQDDIDCSNAGGSGGTCFYDPGGQCATSGGVTTAVSGSISPDVGKGLPSMDQQNLQKALVAGATKWKVDPNFLAAEYYVENFQGGDSGGNDATGGEIGDGQWRDPAPPYGQGAPYTSPNSAGASGPFQMGSVPGSAAGDIWATVGQDGNGDGKADVNDLVDASFGAAKYLASLGAANTTDQAKLRAAAASYFGDHNSNGVYAGNVWGVYNHLSGGSQSSVSGSSGGCGSSGGGSANCTSATGNAQILCEAKQYQGIYYLLGGGHSYSAFKQACPASSLSSAAASSTAGNPGPCATDCSGLVSVAVDDAFGQSFSWDVQSLEDDTKNWQSIPIDSVQPGDVVTVDPDVHVEIVDHYDSSTKTLYTFGSHAPGVQTGGTSSPTSYWSGAYRYVGPGSSP